jgi:predicted DNA-binding ribbon-helix-helix protein
MTLLTAPGNNHCDCCRWCPSRQNLPCSGPILALSARKVQAVSFRRKTAKIINLNFLCGLPIVAAMQQSGIVKRSVRIAGHATSISLEVAFWQGLCDIASSRQMSVNALIATIDATRNGNLSSAIRLFVLDSAQRGELRGAGTGASLAPSE